MFKRLPFFALFAILCASTVCLAQRNNTIRGSVRTTSGTPISNAIVELRVSGGGMIGQTVSGSEGDFQFDSLVAGNYEVAVTSPDYVPSVQIARFNHAPTDNFQETINVEVVLRAKADRALAPPGTTFAQDVPKKARDLYQKGMGKLGEKKLDECVQFLTQATAVFPDYFDAHYALAALYYGSNKLDDAVQSLERARQINGRDSAVYQLFGMVMLKQGKLMVAEYAFKQASALDPSRPGPRFYRGYALLALAAQEKQVAQRSADLDESEKEFNSAWDLSEKKLYQVHLQLARIDEIRGQIQPAISELELYLKSAPAGPESDAVKHLMSSLKERQK